MEGLLRVLIFVFFVFAVFVRLSLADLQKYRLYPTTNCFNNVPTLFRRSPVDDVSDDCIDEYTEENLFCYKICMLRMNLLFNVTEIPPGNYSQVDGESEETRKSKFEKIQAFNHTTDLLTILNGFLRYYYSMKGDDFLELGNDTAMEEVFFGMEKRARKCETMGVVMPRNEYLCSALTPETKERMENLKNCVEDVLTCEM